VWREKTLRCSERPLDVDCLYQTMTSRRATLVLVRGILDSQNNKYSTRAATPQLLKISLGIIAT
jgi:hypothetical protein